MNNKTKIKQLEDYIRECDRESSILSDLSSTVKAKSGRIEGIKGATDKFIAELDNRKKKIAKRRKALSSELAEYQRRERLADAKRRYKASKAEYRRLRWG